jgi:hypothetical protein
MTLVKTRVTFESYFVDEDEERFYVTEIVDEKNKVLGRGMAIRAPEDAPDLVLATAISMERATADFQRKLHKARQGFQYGRTQ